MNKKNIKKFEENGYHTFNFINKSKLNEVKKDLYVMVLDSLKSNAPEFLKKNKKKIKNKLFILNEGLIYLEKKDHKHLTKIYDVIAKTTSFLNLMCDKKIIDTINVLLKRKKTAIYILTQTALEWICLMIKNSITVGTEITIQIFRARNFYNYGCLLFQI